MDFFSDFDQNKKSEVDNSFIAIMEKLEGITACGPECQREKKIDELKREYESILRQQNRDQDEESKRVRDARKNYFTYAFGERYYDEYERKLSEEDADKHDNNFKAIHEELKRDILKQESEKRENKMAINRMKQLLKKVNVSNENMLDSLDNTESTVETSNRRVYYTMKKLDRVDFYRKIISTILKALLAIGIMYFSYNRKFLALAIIVISYLLILHFS